MYGIIVSVHLLAATVWTGGHLILALTILPRALRQGSAESIRQFEIAYERVGIPALIIQVATGLWLAGRLLPDTTSWLSVGDCIPRLVSFKLALLAITVVLGLDARLRIIPNLSDRNLVSLAWHIVPVTVASVLFLLAGASLRNGWLC